MSKSASSEPETEELLELIQDLQIRVSYQEDSLQSLNDVIAAQDALIAQLQEQVKYCAEKIKGLESSSTAPAPSGGDERPPHY